MKFRNGREMWNAYGQGIDYNPFENLHLGVNTRIKDQIKYKSLGNSEHDKSLIEQARSLLMRIRIGDMFYNGVCEIVQDDLEYAFEQGRKEDENIPELWDIWNGFTAKEIKVVANTYVGLLDPLTLYWIDTDETGVEYDRDKNEYTFNREKPVDEYDTTFCYAKDEHPPERERGWLAVYEYATECFQDHVPSEVWKIYREIEGY